MATALDDQFPWLRPRVIWRGGVDLRATGDAQCGAAAAQPHADRHPAPVGNGHGGPGEGAGFLHLDATTGPNLPRPLSAATDADPDPGLRGIGRQAGGLVPVGGSDAERGGGA